MRAEEHSELVNDVLVTNYFGELLTVELLSRFLQRFGSWSEALTTRQLMDEARHAHVTRALLRERGCDPQRGHDVTAFTYHQLFAAWSMRSAEEMLAFLGQNERSSSRNFAALIRVGEAAGDDALVGVYGEILNDESNHARSIFAALPDTDEIRALARTAEHEMRATFNFGYARLAAAYPEAFKVGVER
jgi:hypothetical protein